MSRSNNTTNHRSHVIHRRAPELCSWNDLELAEKLEIPIGSHDFPPDLSKLHLKVINLPRQHSPRPSHPVYIYDPSTRAQMTCFNEAWTLESIEAYHPAVV